MKADNPYHPNEAARMSGLLAKLAPDWEQHIGEGLWRFLLSESRDSKNRVVRNVVGIPVRKCGGVGYTRDTPVLAHSVMPVVQYKIVKGVALVVR